MKKVLAVVLCLLMIGAICCVAGCGKKADDNVLTMGTNVAFPPYEYYEGGKPVGIDVEIAEKLAEKLGMTLKVEDIAFNAIVDGVKSGKYDIGMAGMTVRPDRLENVNFSNTYAKGVQVVIVKEDSAITSVDDLGAEGATYKIGVQTATTGDVYAQDDFGSDRVTGYNAGADAVEALKTGKVDCVIIDNEPAKAFVRANEGLKILETAYADEDYAIAVAKENTELLEKINKALKELTDDGTIAQIVAKYIPAEG